MTAERSAPEEEREARGVQAEARERVGEIDATLQTSVEVQQRPCSRCTSMSG